MLLVGSLRCPLNRLDLRLAPQLQVNLPEPMSSGRSLVFQDSTCLCQARPKMCGSMPSETKACCYTSRPHRGQGLGTDMLTHPARRISYSETTTHARSCRRKKLVTVVQVLLSFLTFTGTQPPSGTGSSAYKAFSGTGGDVSATRCEPFTRTLHAAARGSTQTSPAPRASVRYGVSDSDSG